MAKKTTQLTVAQQLALKSLYMERQRIEGSWNAVMIEAGIDPMDNTVQIDLETGKVNYMKPQLDTSEQVS